MRGDHDIVLAVLAPVLAGLILVLAPIVYRRYDGGRYGYWIAACKIVTVGYCRLWFRLRCVGEGKIPTDGPVIVVANHTVSIDPVLLSAVCPGRHISFLIADEYTTIPVLRRIIKWLECIPVKRDGLDTAATRTAMRRLRAGHILGIFPEGGIPRPNETLEAKDGAALLALRTGAPVIPVHISGTIYSDSVVYPVFLPHRARLTIGPPVDLEPYRATMRDRATVAAATAEILRCIRMLGKPSIRSTKRI